MRPRAVRGRDVQRRADLRAVGLYDQGRRAGIDAVVVVVAAGGGVEGEGVIGVGGNGERFVPELQIRRGAAVGDVHLAGAGGVVAETREERVPGVRVGPDREMAAAGIGGGGKAVAAGEAGIAAAEVAVDHLGVGLVGDHQAAGKDEGCRNRCFPLGTHVGEHEHLRGIAKRFFLRGGFSGGLKAFARRRTAPTRGPWTCRPPGTPQDAPRRANWKFAPLRVTNLEIRHERCLGVKTSSYANVRFKWLR